MRLFYLKDILNIAGPIIMGNLGFILIGVGDVIVAGRHSTDTLSAVSLATAIINCIMICGIGILSSISAILSNYRGAGVKVEKYFYPSLKFTAILSVVMTMLIIMCIPTVDYLGFDENLIPLIKGYFWVTAFSTFGAYLHCMAKEYLQAFQIVVFPNIFTLLSVFVNVALNIIFAFGFWFIPEMGTVGLAVASLITRYFMGIVLFLYCYKKVKVQKYHGKRIILYYRDLLKVGLPASLAVVIEFIGFNAITVILGRISGIYAAAQNIVCTITTISFMIPFAISNATAVKVGFANGARYFKSLKKYAYTGISLSVAFMACSAIVVGTFPKQIVSLFTSDPELVNTCIPVVFILCLFQVFDGLQVSLAGIFKGLKYTNVVMISNFIGYWLISIPLGCTLAFKYHLDFIGFWYGLITSAIVLCTIMFVTMIIKFKTEYKEISCHTSL